MVSYMDCKDPNQFFDKGILFKKKKRKLFLTLTTKGVVLYRGRETECKKSSRFT